MITERIVGFGDTHDFLSATAVGDVRDLDETPAIALGMYRLPPAALGTEEAAVAFIRMFIEARAALHASHAAHLVIVLDLSGSGRWARRRAAVEALRSLLGDLRTDAAFDHLVAATIGIVIGANAERELVRQRLYEFALRPTGGAVGVVLRARSLRSRRLREFLPARTAPVLDAR